MDAAALLLALHGHVLRQISETHGHHYEGLGQCAKSKQFSCGVSRRLRQLDNAAAWIRHVTGPRCSAFVAEIQHELSASVSASETDSWGDFYIGDPIVEVSTQTDVSMANTLVLDAEGLASMVRGLCRDGTGHNDKITSNSGCVGIGLNNDGKGDGGLCVGGSLSIGGEPFIDYDTGNDSGSGGLAASSLFRWKWKNKNKRRIP
jgi:hypothetical protein